MENNIKNTLNRFNVVIRIKPQLKDDYSEYNTDEEMQICTTKLVSEFLTQSEREIKLVKPMIEERIFDFDKVLSPSSTQSESYDKIAMKTVSDVLQGYNGTIMAYGQVLERLI
jgi:hypothetical protein